MSDTANATSSRETGNDNHNAPEDGVDRASPLKPPGIYLVFEGGGAKGIAHLGAFKAIEEFYEARRQFDDPKLPGPAFQVLGTAGTSVGAIMAALVAAGYTADELYRLPMKQPDGSLEEPKSLFRTNWAETFFGLKEWNRAWRFIRDVTSLRKFFRPEVREWGRTYLVVSLGAIACAAIGSWEAARVVSIWLLVIALLVVIAAAVMPLWRLIRGCSDLWSRHGLMETARFEDWLDRSLRAKIAGSLLQLDDVMASHLPVETFAVVSANVTSKTMTRQFYSTGLDSGAATVRSEDFAVVPAVASSMCVPLLFQPQRGDTIQVDGGIVANCPAWMFDGKFSDEEHFPLTPIVVLRFANPPATRRVGFLNYVEDLLLTGLFGEKTPPRDIPPGRVHTIELPVPDSFLEFDLSPLRQDHYFEAARQRTLDYLRDPQDFWPTERWRVETALGRLLKVIAVLVDQLRGAAGEEALHLRANVMLRLERGRLGIVYSVNMQGDPDRFPVLRFRRCQGCCGLAWETRKIQIADLSNLPSQIKRQYLMDEWQQRLIRDGLKAVVSIPLLDPRERKNAPRGGEDFLGILNIDSDDVTAREFETIFALGGERLQQLLTFLVYRELLPIADDPAPASVH